MSNWTENTIVIKKEDKQLFDNEFLSFADNFDYRLEDYELLYSNEGICVIGFDSNGDNPWYQRTARCPFLLVSIYYYDHRCPLIEYYDGRGRLHETSRTSLKRALARFIPKEDYDAFCEELWPVTPQDNELTIWHTKKEIYSRLKAMEGLGLDEFTHSLSEYFGCKLSPSQSDTEPDIYECAICTPTGVTLNIVVRKHHSLDIVTDAYLYDPCHLYRCPSRRSQK